MHLRHFWSAWSSWKEDKLVLTIRTAADDLRDQGYYDGAGGSGTGAALANDETEITDDNHSALDDDPSQHVRHDPVDQDPDIEDYGEDDATDPSYKKRFVNSQKVHLENKRQIESLSKTIEELREQLAAGRTTDSQDHHPPPPRPSSNINTDETARRLNEELSDIDGTDAQAQTKRIGKWVDTIKHTSEQIAMNVAEQVLTHREALKAATEQAKVKAIESLKTVGLSEEDFPLFDREVAFIKATDPQFFTRTRGDKQFSAIAERVKDNVSRYLSTEQRHHEDRIREANERQNARAAGHIDTRSTTSPTSRRKADDVPDRGFSDQLRDMRRTRFEEGKRIAARPR